MATVADVRAQLDGLPPGAWAERFDVLARAEKAATGDQRADIVRIREQLADACLQELRGEWGRVPLKHGILRLEGTKLRAALTRAAKRARDREVANVVRAGGIVRPLRRESRFGRGFDERIIELPLALAVARLDRPGEVLDAGASLNLPVVREISPEPAARVTHVTFAGGREPVLRGSNQYVYVFGDLRAMPFDDGVFDRVVCISTLEHVGLDNTRYGGTAEQAPQTAVAAVQELVRVVRPGGVLVFTVPYGRAADQGWFRTFDAGSLAALAAAAAPLVPDARFFYYDDGWFEGTSEPAEAVRDRQYSADVVTGMAVVTLVKGVSGDRP